MDDIILPGTATPRQRPIPVGWKEAPLDMQQQGFKGMLVVHLPVRREWRGEDQHNRVAQIVADAALHALVALENE